MRIAHGRAALQRAAQALLAAAHWTAKPANCTAGQTALPGHTNAARKRSESLRFTLLLQLQK